MRCLGMYVLMTKSQWFDEGNPDFPLAPIYLLGKKNTNKNKGMKENNLLSLSYGNIIRKNIDDTGGLRPDSFETYQVVKPGDTVLRFTDLQNDHRSLRSGLVTERGIITSAYIGFRPNSRIVNPAFFAYVMRALDGMKAFYEMGSGVRQSLNWEEFSALFIPLPAPETQRRIADYLDKEIGEMDALIENSEGLVAALESRKSLLVKRTFDSLNADTTQMGLFAKFISGRDWSEVEDENGEYPVFGSGSQMGYANDYFYDGEAVIFGRKGTLNKPRRVSGRFWVVDTAYVAAPNEQLDVNFFYYWAQTLPFELLSTQTAIPSMTATDLKLQRIPVIPLSKQQEIADELDREFEKMGSLIEESTKLIENLKARKTALITEVVTGRKEV